jgi:adenylate cyclase
MAEQRVQRRLAAILAADVVGYSRLMGEDEEGTLAALTAHLAEIIEPCIAEHRGRVVKTTGDGLLVEFASVVDAVRCAVAFQDGMRERNTAVPEERRMEFRIGVNLGDVIVQDDDVFGDGVNVAARLEGLAEAGGICVSDMVYQSVRSKLDLTFDDLGPQRVKNIGEPVRAFHIRHDAPSKVSAIGQGDPLPLPDKPSIAVLPFENMSGDPEQEYFVDGICEDAITALSRIRWFFVIARNSTFAYKGKSPDVREVASDLGVRYVLEGSVRKAGNRIRLTAQLIDGTNGTHLWAERYDRDIEDIFDLQDELTQTIVGAIEPELSKAEQGRAQLKKPETLDVWDLFQRGMSELHRLTVDSLSEAEATLTRVTEIDSDFAASYAGLVDVHYYKLVLGFTEDPETSRKKALAAGRRAVELDREDSRARCALARAYHINRMFDAGILEFQAALEINPSNALAHHGLGASYVYSKSPEAALPHLDNAIRLSPRDANLGSFYVRKAQAHLYLQNHDEAVVWARRALQLPNFQWSRYVMLISALGHLGKIDEARPALEELLCRIPKFSAQYALDFSPWLDNDQFRHLINGLHKAGWKG